jgi:hypothetical protein
MYSISIKASTHQGWGELRGMLHFGDGVLRMQHKASDAVLGLLTSRAKEQEINLDLLSRVDYLSGFLGLFPRIELQFSDFVVASTLPGVNGTTMTLSVCWRERLEAREMVESLEAARALRRTMALEGDINRLSRVDPLAGLRDAALSPASSKSERKLSA